MNNKHRFKYIIIHDIKKELYIIEIKILGWKSKIELDEIYRIDIERFESKT